MKNTLAGIAEKILNLWCATGILPSRITGVFLGCLVLICGGCALIGVVPTLIFGHDDFFLLENGWRVLSGLRPQVDFWSPWGPVSFVVVALGLKISNATANGIAYGNAMFALLVGVWTYGIGRHRLQPVPRALLSLYAAVLACAPYPIGMAPMALSHAMTYNRYGYALLIPLLVECFQPAARAGRQPADSLGAVSTGVVLGLAFFLKVSYFFAGAGLVLVSLLLSPGIVRRFVGIVAGFAAISFVCLAYLKFQMGAMLRALHMAAGARAQSLSAKTIVYNLIMHLVPLFCVIGLAVLASFFRPRRGQRLGDFYLPVLAVAVFVADLALFSTNSQSAGLPLLGAFAILLADRVAEFRSESPHSGQQFAVPFFLAVIFVSAILFLPQFTADVAAIPIAAVRKVHPPAGCGLRFTQPRVRSLLLCDSSGEGDLQTRSNGSTYTTYVNDGVALLLQCCDAKDRVLDMDMQNPFPYVLGWKPPTGGLAATAYNYTLSDNYRPSMDEYFGDATVVMVPKHPAIIPLYGDRFYETYVPEVKQRYHLAAESDWFWLYKRN